MRHPASRRAPQAARVIGGGATREREPPARPHPLRAAQFPCRCGTQQASAPPGSSKSDGRGVHPGARASRPHALPLRAAQFPCDGGTRQAGAPPSSSKSDRRRSPPGSAGVPPACTAVAADQFPCDGAPGHPYGGNGMGPGRSRVLAPLTPVDPGGADCRGFAKICAGGTPALPGGHPAGLSGI